MKRTEILLVDDHEIFRDCLVLRINREPDMVVIGQARTGREALAKARDLKPDLVLMDLSMPEMGGLEATRLLKQQFPAMKILVLTVHEDKNFLIQICKSEASGYVTKGSASNELIDAIRSVIKGGVYVDNKLARDVLATRGQSQKGRTIQKTHELSDREKEVLRGIALGYTYKEIGSQLRISLKSVETYKLRLEEKLDMHGRPEMVQYASARGWLAAEKDSRLLPQ